MRFSLFIVCLSIVYVSCASNSNKISENELVTSDTVVFENKEAHKVSTLEQSLIDAELINITDLDTTILIDLKYASTNNFTKVILYDSLNDVYLHPIAAKKLVEAQRFLKEIDASLTLLVYDAARPLSVQKKMYDVVQNTRYRSYVANPTRTGLHNYGVAVDLTICNLDEGPLDMGTPFDYFGKEAGIRNEAAYLTKKQIQNRDLLRKVMIRAGFLTILGEWWHFNALPLAEAKKTCKLLR